MDNSPHEDINALVMDLFKRAEEYADIAIERFYLDPPAQDKIPEVDEVSELANLVGALMRQYPCLAKTGKRRDYVMHYLFPNLTDTDRALLSGLSYHAGRIPYVDGETLDRQNEFFAKFKDEYKSSGIETKLSAVQIALIDSSVFDPNSPVKIDLNAE